MSIITVRGYDANNNYLGVSHSTTVGAEGWRAIYQVCDPAADIDGYIYDNDHYVIRFAYCAAGQNRGAQAALSGFYELYCYGSATSFLDSFGPSTTYNSVNMGSSGSSYRVPFTTASSSITGLFREDIGVGYQKEESMGFGYSGLMGQMYNIMRERLWDRWLPSEFDSHYGDPARSGGGAWQNSYRTYREPDFCSVPHPVGWRTDSFNSDKFRGPNIDPHRENAVIYIGSVDEPDTTYTANWSEDCIMKDNGATPEHKSIIKGVFNNLSSYGDSRTFTGNSFSGAGGNVNVAIYPIKQSTTSEKNADLTKPAWRG